jgi:hypothetical protein
MKRSEMVFLINNAIYDYDHTMKGHDFDSAGTYILRKIEEAGMLPPKSLDTVCVKKGLVRGYTQMFEWEPEDE